MDLGYDVIVTITGIVLVFLILVLLMAIITLEGKIFDAMNGKKAAAKAAPKAAAKPAAPAAKPAAAASAPKIVLPTAAPKQPAKPSVSLPKANMSRPKPVSVKPLQPVEIKSDSPSVLSVAVDFIAAAVAVAFAVMIVLDV